MPFVESLPINGVAARDVDVGEPWIFEHRSQAQIEHAAIRGYGDIITRESMAFIRLLTLSARELGRGANLTPLRPQLAACLLVGSADEAIELTAALIDGPA